MYESFLLVSDIHKGSIERRHNLLHLAEEDIPDRETVPLAGLLVQFDETMVLHQCNPYLISADIYNQVFD